MLERGYEELNARQLLPPLVAVLLAVPGQQKTLVGCCTRLKLRRRMRRFCVDLGRICCFPSLPEAVNSTNELNPPSSPNRNDMRCRQGDAGKATPATDALHLNRPPDEYKFDASEKGRKNSSIFVR